MASQKGTTKRYDTNHSIITYNIDCNDSRKADFKAAAAGYFRLADYRYVPWPHGFALLNSDLLNTHWYELLLQVLECSVGLMLGTELVCKRLKKSGKSIIITTLTQSIGTFLLVSLVFGIVFYFSNIPFYLALIPMAVLDDIVGVIIFFTTISIVGSTVSNQKLPAYMILVIVFLPLIIGAVIGLPAGLLLKKERSTPQILFIVIAGILITSVLGYLCNTLLMQKPVLNFMLMGMAFSAFFSNIVPEERLEQIVKDFNPLLALSIIIVILDLGAPLDYHLIMGAGAFTVIYILTRACGKYFGAYLGASITKSPETVRKFLGLTLLPHSGVSLIFTGIAVSVLSPTVPEYAKMIQGTIAAAAIINEIIAVIAAKKGFELAGEFHQNHS